MEILMRGMLYFSHYSNVKYWAWPYTDLGVWKSYLTVRTWINNIFWDAVRSIHPKTGYLLSASKFLHTLVEVRAMLTFHPVCHPKNYIVIFLNIYITTKYIWTMFFKIISTSVMLYHKGAFCLLNMIRMKFARKWTEPSCCYQYVVCVNKLWRS